MDTASAPLARVARLCRYPVNGLSAETLDRVALAPGEALPDDRRFALARVGTPFDLMKPKWLPKTHFLMLIKNERLALLQSRYDGTTGMLEIWRGGKRLASGVITTPVGRAVIEDFFAAFMRAEALGKPTLLVAPGHVFSDNREKVVSMINLAGVAQLERIVGRRVDPLRFRANVYVEGVAPWAEFGWLERDIVVGTARLKGLRRISRCAATDVDPATGVRDLKIPQALKNAYGHTDMGIYATVTARGTLAADDTIHVI